MLHLILDFFRTKSSYLSQIECPWKHFYPNPFPLLTRNPFSTLLNHSWTEFVVQKSIYLKIIRQKKRFSSNSQKIQSKISSIRKHFTVLEQNGKDQVKKQGLFSYFFPYQSLHRKPVTSFYFFNFSTFKLFVVHLIIKNQNPKTRQNVLRKTFFTRKWSIRVDQKLYTSYTSKQF